MQVSSILGCVSVHVGAGGTNNNKKRAKAIAAKNEIANRTVKQKFKELKGNLNSIQK
jgi:hypothetical protein